MPICSDNFYILLILSDCRLKKQFFCAAPCMLKNCYFQVRTSTLFIKTAVFAGKSYSFQQFLSNQGPAKWQ